ncbi:MAG: anhydro-N-acetylmuramic acid kinase [Planctomycetota bacterium]
MGSPPTADALAARFDPEGADGGAPPLVAGVMSGTSGDGIDVVLCVPAFRMERGRRRLASLAPRAFRTLPFEPGLAVRVRAVLDGAPVTLGETAALHRDLGLAFGRAARAVADEAGAGPLALVASHGQTVFHHDGVPELRGVTLQLGDGDAVAEAAGCAAATDFRTRDCAAGGEGAPLVALVDDVLFSAAPRPLAVLNLGGIANWTVLVHSAAPLAFDTGPAAALLDGLARARLGADYDEDGRAAAAGSPDPAAVAVALDHPFFGRPAPKSTGRDTFGPAYVEAVGAAVAHLAPPDALATAVHAVARHAADGLAAARAGMPRAADPLHVAVAGGGARNAALMGALEAALRASPPIASFATSAAHGVDPDAREALAFAALGARLLVGEPSTVPTATGAAPGRVLGKWSCAAESGPAA